MKTTLMHVSSQIRLHKLLRQALLFAAAASVAGGAVSAVAQTAVDKANSYTSLATPADWSGGAVPGANNIAVWNAGSGTPVAEPLGASLTWAGIQILNPLGPITISADGNTLTNGEVGIVGLNGIDMSSASQNLTLNNNVVVTGVQNWNIGSGETLTLGGTLSANSGAAIRFHLAAGANAVVTNAPNTLLGPTNGGAAGGNVFATVNDVDFAGVNASQQIVPATGLGIYTPNASGNPPSISGTINGVIDCTNAGSGTYGGVRLSNTLTIWGLLFNETNATYGNWQVNDPSSRNLTIGSILVTTNCGNNPINFVNGGGSPLITIPGTTGSLLFYQNNPAAPLTIQAGLTIRQGTATGTVGSVVKMGAGLVDIQSVSTYAGGTRVYEGTMQIDGVGSVGAGALNVYGGTFAQSSGTTNPAPTTIYSGSTNNVLAVAANSQSFDNSTLTFNAGSTLEFFYSNTIAPSTTVSALTLTNINGLTLNSPVNVEVLCGGFSTGTFPLVSYAGTLGGGGYPALSSLTLPPHILGYLSNDVTHSLIDLVVTNVDQPIAWNAPSGTWDIGFSANWLDPLGNTTTYQQTGPLGDNVAFTDTAPGPSITVSLNTSVTPSSVTVNNANNTYTISGNGSIGGIGAFTKTGSGTVTLATTNSFTGGANINGGTVVFNTLPNLGAAGISFGGGTLQYNGNSDDISARTVTFTAAGATINTSGSTVNYANPIGNNGAGGLTKTGAGTLTLNGTNTFNGITTVSQGTLALGANTYLTNSPALMVNSGAVLDTASSGVNLSLSSRSSQILTGNGQVNGVVTALPQTTVSPGTMGTTATLSINGGYTMNGGTNFTDIAATSNDLIAISGTGSLTLNNGTVMVNLIGSVPNGRYVIMTYSGSLSGSVANITPLYPAGNQIASLDSSVSGQIAVVLSQAAHDVLTWPGTGTSWDEQGTLDWLNGGTPWAFTNGDTVTFNDSNTGNTTINLMTNVQPSLVIVSNTVDPTYTFVDGTSLGGGAIDGNGSLLKDGTGTLVMNTANSYRGTTTIKNGTLQIGSGGIGNIGSGNVTNNATLIFEEGDGALHGVAGAVSGTGSLTVNGNATVILEANNTYTGPTTISAGTLQVGNFGTTGNLGSTPAVTNNGILAIDVNGPVTFPYNVTGTGSLEAQGQGSASLAGSTLTYQGSTEISNGIVKLGANNEIPNTNNVAGSSGGLSVDGGTSTAGTLDMNGFNATVNSLAGAQNNVNGIITNGSTVTTTTNVLSALEVASTTYNGEINDHGTTGSKIRLFVTGPGTLTLNPTNSSLFSGGIIVSNGSLALGTPGGNGVVNINESQLAPGTGPITLLGTNTSLITDGVTGSTVPTYLALTNTLIVPAGQNVTVYGPCRGSVNSTLIGSGIFNYDTTYSRDSVAGNWSGFTGQVILTGNSTGGNVGFTVTNALANCTVLMTTDVAAYSESAGSVFSIGALAGGDQSCQLEGNGTGGANSGAANVTFAIGGLNTSTIYTGGILDTNNLLKVGTGTLTLNCGGVLFTNVVPDTNTGFNVTVIGYGADRVTYDGNTTISNGVLALDAPVNLNNSTNVTIASPSAVLDASDMGFISNLNVTLENGATQEVVVDSTFEVVSNQTFGSQTLGGIGTLNGFVQADQGSILAPGLPTGTFNVTSNASLAGLVQMNLDDTDAVACSTLAAPSFTINSTATLLVTNVGPGLSNNVTFVLFNHPVSGFATVALPATDPTGTTNYTWQNNLAVNGSITLTNGGLVIGPTLPPHIKFSVSGTTLTLSWPPPYLGEVLQAQTNSVKIGLSNNWVNVTGSASVTNMTFTINPGNGTVFYRLAP